MWLNMNLPSAINQSVSQLISKSNALSLSFDLKQCNPLTWCTTVHPQQLFFIHFPNIQQSSHSILCFSPCLCHFSWSITRDGSFLCRLWHSSISRQFHASWFRNGCRPVDRSRCEFHCLDLYVPESRKSPQIAHEMAIVVFVHGRRSHFGRLSFQFL